MLFIIWIWATRGNCHSDSLSNEINIKGILIQLVYSFVPNRILTLPVTNGTTQHKGSCNFDFLNSGRNSDKDNFGSFPNSYWVVCGFYCYNGSVLLISPKLPNHMIHPNVCNNNPRAFFFCLKIFFGKSLPFCGILE